MRRLQPNTRWALSRPYANRHPPGTVSLRRRRAAVCPTATALHRRCTSQSRPPSPAQPSRALTLTHVAVSPTANDAPFSFHLQLRSRDAGAALFAAAKAVSDPSSPRYGQYLSKEEIAAIAGHSAEDERIVRTWLENAGPSHWAADTGASLSAHASKPGPTSHLTCSSLAPLGIAYAVRGSAVHVQTTLSAASRLLSTAFRQVKHVASGQTVVRAGAYVLPADVREAAPAIFGLHGVPVPHMKPLRVNAGAVAVTPAVIEQTYNVGNVTVNRQGKNLQAVAEFQNQYMDKSDLSAFFKSEVPTAQPGDDQINAFKGAPYTAGTSGEADLDTQFIMGGEVGEGGEGV